MKRSAKPVVLLALLATPTRAEEAQVERNFVGTVQLDYMLVPTHRIGRDISLDGATMELSLKLTQDFGEHVSSSVKVCVACHGLEVGMAYFDLRVSDELNFPIGRFTPAFGEFPIRHDPANHRTSDKPLPYDMGRMLRKDEWNLGVLPSPWVDNGIELNGTHFVDDDTQLDYAAYLIGGPRTTLDVPIDFEFAASRRGESYYVDNNSRPTIGAFFAASHRFGDLRVTAGGSLMTGSYDKDAELDFELWGLHAVGRYRSFTLRGEYLRRRTEMSPMAPFKYELDHRDDIRDDRIFVKEGYVLELEVPISAKIDGVLRWDGLHRVGNNLAGNPLGPNAGIVRLTAGGTIGLYEALRLKVSAEYYDFRDFENETVLHVGVAGPF